MTICDSRLNWFQFLSWIKDNNHRIILTRTKSNASRESRSKQVMCSSFSWLCSKFFQFHVFCHFSRVDVFSLLQHSWQNFLPSSTLLFSCLSIRFHSLEKQKMNYSRTKLPFWQLFRQWNDGKERKRKTLDWLLLPIEEWWHKSRPVAYFGRHSTVAEQIPQD